MTHSAERKTLNNPTGPLSSHSFLLLSKHPSASLCVLSSVSRL